MSVSLHETLHRASLLFLLWVRSHWFDRARDHNVRHVHVVNSRRTIGRQNNTTTTVLTKRSHWTTSLHHLKLKRWLNVTTLKVNQTVNQICQLNKKIMPVQFWGMLVHFDRWNSQRYAVLIFLSIRVHVLYTAFFRLEKIWLMMLIRTMNESWHSLFEVLVQWIRFWYIREIQTHCFAFHFSRPTKINLKRTGELVY